MIYIVLFKTEALKEYLEAYDWYEEKQEGLGRKFQGAIEDKLNFICENTQLYALSKSNFRQAVINDFPYVIVYKLKPASKIVYISAVFHTSRNPRKKYRR